MINTSLWLRWSWRDLRARWLQVVAIALIIALGTGVFAGLGGQKTWRINSLDLSYERLQMYDLRVQLADGSYVDQQALQNALSGIQGVDRMETRLIAPTLVDASTPDQAVLVEGRIVSVDVADGGPTVNKVFIEKGRNLTPSDAGTDAVVVEYKFAKYYDLTPGDSIRISGDQSLDFVGEGYGPEYFLIIPQEGSYLAESSFAVLFTSLETAQKLTGREGLVNDVVFRLQDGADAAAVRAAITQQMAAAFPTTGITITDRQDDWGYKQQYEDAKNDQVTWDMVALLFLIGAALGAFNLAGRIVEAQRRQIGISMALGLPRVWIALRPMLIGLQIAALGTVFGLLVGIALSQLFANLFKSLLPLPYWETGLYVPGFLRATLLGILLPLVATLIPVIRAVRVAPIDAIRTGNLISKGGGLSWLMNIIPIPGKSFTQMPFRNILRSPWRSLLTVLGIAMAIVLMTAFIGFLDTFLVTMDRAGAAYEYENPDRLLVSLDSFYPTSNGDVSAIQHLTADDGSPLFSQVETALMVGGTLIDSRDPDNTVDVALELHDMNTAIWVPKLLKGQLTSDPPGIILSEKAAHDMGVGVGDTVTLKHPRREGPLAFKLVQDEVPVIGIHDNPLRALSYMDMSGESLLGVAGVTNLLVVNPARGVTAQMVKSALMNQPGVASVQAVTDFSKALDDVLNMFVTVLRVIQGIVLFMAFLIAFNSTSINVDERVREISTMFAFGLPVRTVTRMQMLENLVIGILGTVIGVIGGWYVLNAFLAARVEEQLADLQLIVTISTSTLLISMVLGVLVVALTPLLSIRRMLRLDIPSTLRVME